ncbi:DNA cytosine methyltransferase [Cereibacter johrii]|uniref:DNA cytosine methyltransferase n=1 Tax=Cereibacter johrii TaxID=445629 RepID=UPI000DCCC386|nr:DNA cytosine methyltransferase [Cereibacter johrii]RAZ84458.1 DNA (cytosine-5-)-methyltransferase [Cereibacter johrii]
MSSTDKTIVAVDLFCGAGGLTHGLERAGIDVRLGVDVDPSCKHPFSANNNASFLLADVDDLDASTVANSLRGGRVTLLAGCAPCQPFSTYSRSAARKGGGKRKGRGSRDDWRLVQRFGELVRALQPDLVTMENVPPLLDQPVFAELLTCLDGYSVDHRIVDVRDVGLPQTRKRLVVVASKLGPIELAAPDNDGGPATVRQAIGSLRPVAAGEADPSDPLHAASRLSAINLQRIRASKPGSTWRDWPDELRAKCHQRSTGATYPAVYGRMEWDQPSPTITTQCFGYGNGRFGHPEQDRAITLREAAMLQGFPANYSFLAGEDRPSFARIGRLIGNAVPVPLGEYVGRILRNHVDAFLDKEELGTVA